MLRGGRSWPSETKLTAGEVGAENVSLADSSGAKTTWIDVAMAVPVQQEAQRLHLSAWAASPGSA